MEIKFIKEYAFAHGGVRIERFAVGQVVKDPCSALLAFALSDKAAIDLSEKSPEPEEPKKRAKKG